MTRPIINLDQLEYDGFLLFAPQDAAVDYWQGEAEDE